MSFDRRSKQRISRSVIRTERQDQSRTAHGKRRKVGAGSGGSFVRYAKTRAAGVPARDGLQLGSAIVDEYEVTELGMFAATGETFTAWNPAGAQVGGNTWIGCEQELYHKLWIIIFEDCA